MLNIEYKPWRTALGSTLLFAITLAGCANNDNNGGSNSNENNNTQTTTINVQLAANQQVPPSASLASASGELTLNNTTGALAGSVSSTGMSITAAHIHTGDAGSNGDVIIGLEVDGNTAAVPASTVLTEDQIAEIQNGTYYINLHSEAYPAGEIRGQILPDGIQVLSVNLTGENEIPPTTNAGTGTGYVTLRDATRSANISIISSTDTPAAAAHLHNGFDGENGGVILGLEADDTEPGRFTGSAELTSADYEQVKQGGSYLNLHTQANPGGELRGQLLPDGIKVYSAFLNGEQEIPAVTTSADGTGHLTLNTKENTLTAIVRTNNLSEVTMAHIHAGARGENGDVIAGLELNAEDGTVWEIRNATIDDSNRTLIESEGTYFNVHTSNYPSGELRGQIINKPSITSSVAKVKARSQQFVQEFANNNGAELARFYTENATLTLPGQATVTGRTSIGEAWQGAFTQGGLRVVRLTIDSIEMGANTEEYIEQGRYSLDVEGAEGATTLESTYVVTWSVPADGSEPLITDDQINP